MLILKVYPKGNIDFKFYFVTNMQLFCIKAPVKHIYFKILPVDKIYFYSLYFCYSDGSHLL